SRQIGSDADVADAGRSVETGDEQVTGELPFDPFAGRHLERHRDRERGARHVGQPGQHRGFASTQVHELALLYSVVVHSTLPSIRGAHVARAVLPLMKTSICRQGDAPFGRILVIKTDSNAGVRQPGAGGWALSGSRGTENRRPTSGSGRRGYRRGRGAERELIDVRMSHDRVVLGCEPLSAGDTDSSARYIPSSSFRLGRPL